MRRNIVVAAGLAALVAGCGVFSARTDAVEQAAGQELSAQHLADLMTAIKAPGITIDPPLAELVTTMWTDATLFSQAVAKNELKADSATVADAMWLPISNVLISRWMNNVVEQRVKISDATIDSNYKADQVRAVQHILIKVDTLAPKEDQAAQLKKANDLLAEARSGTNFGKLAIANTDDEGSKADSGWYGLAPIARWDKNFGKALSQLKPGEVSGLVRSAYGWHIIRRPSDEEARKIWHDSLVRAVELPTTEAYTSEISKSSHLKIDPNALPRAKEALQDLAGHEQDKSTLMSYDGGTLTTGRFAHLVNSAVSANPSQGRQELATLRAAPDSDLTHFINVLGQSELLLNEARKHNIRLTADEWKQMISGFTQQIDTLRASMGITDAVLDPKASTSDRSKAAAEKIDQYMNNIVALKQPSRPLPGALGAVLRSRAHARFNAVALQRAVDLAKAKHAADSVKVNGAGDGSIKPAPQGPPVGAPTGGDTATHKP